jgi:pimeloyl-ACP methyl ester carboxylesterase
MPALATRGVELSWDEVGRGTPVLLVHETATGAAAWRGVADAVSPGARAVAYERRGWSDASIPDGYRRTTVEEQSEDAASLLESLGSGPAVVAGAGLGAVVALDLLLRRPELIAGAVLVEPPLLALLPEATVILSGDLTALESEAGRGREALAELYLTGGLGALGAGVGRLPAELTAAGRERPASVVAELGAVPGWGMPLARLAEASRPSRVVLSGRSPALLAAAGEALTQRLPGAELRHAGAGEGPPHVEAPEAVAAVALELLPR